MTAQPKLASIVMPVYNGEKFLNQAIESVLDQTYPHWELIIIDDGSTDQTANIIRSYSDERIKYTYQENRGQAAALNHGLRLAQGDYVTTLDADDWYPANSLEDRVTFLNQNPDFGTVYGDGNYCNETGDSLLKFSEHMPNGVCGDVYDTLIVSPFYGTGATVLIRESVLDQHKINYDETIVWCQDWDFYIRVAAKTTYGYVNTNTIQYRLHGDGMTMAMPEGRRLDSLIRTRHKVLNSPRYQKVSDLQKGAFFYDFLMRDLKDNIQEQKSVFDSEAFNALPNQQQARLLRIVAIDYLLQEKHTELAIKWLQRAWSQSPLDPKTVVVTFLSTINIKLARSIIRLWQQNQPPTTEISPFDLALENHQNPK